jgi:hypothetical protein
MPIRPTDGFLNRGHPFSPLRGGCNEPPEILESMACLVTTPGLL